MKKYFICTECGHDTFLAFDNEGTHYAQCKHCGKNYVIGGVATPQPYTPPEPFGIVSNYFMGVDMAVEEKK